MKRKLLSVFIVFALLLAALPLYTVSAAAATPVEKGDGDVSKNFAGTDNKPYPMTADDVVGAQFSLAADALLVGVSCPSWDDNEGTLTLALYAFDKDYATSVAADPIASHVFENYGDNNFLCFAFTADAPLKAGEYIVEITEAYDENPASGVGVWAQNPYPGQRFYENGEYNPAFSLRMGVEFVAGTPEVPYGKLTADSSGEQSGEIDYMPYFDAMMRFSDDDAELYYTSEGSMGIENLEITEEGYLSVDAKGSDPQFYINLPTWVDGPSRDDYPIMLIRLKTSENVPSNGEIFFTTTDFAGPNAAGCVSVPYEKTAEWQNVIVNMKTNKNFEGMLMSMRYDVCGDASDPVNFLIDYILFFSSVEAAKAFQHEELESMLAARPTPEPATPTPTKAPATKAPTSAPTASATKAPASSDTAGKSGLATGEIIAIAACTVIFIAGIVAVIVIVNKRKKAQNPDGTDDSDTEKKE